MKFLTEDGKIAEGTQLTDEQVLTLAIAEKYLHEHVCHRIGYHCGKPCRDAAIFLVTKDVLGLYARIKFEAELKPEAVEPEVESEAATA